MLFVDYVRAKATGCAPGHRFFGQRETDNAGYISMSYAAN
jgi:hypothetical protein